MNVSSWDALPVKHKVGLFGLVTIIMLYLLYSFLLVPQWAHMDELTTQYQDEQQQVAVVEAFVKSHPHPEGYLLELDNKIKIVDKLLPDQPEVGNFLLQMEQLAKDCDVQLVYLKPGKVSNRQGYRETAVEIAIRGNYAGIMNFLHKTEDGTRFISIANISMQLGAIGLESKIQAKIYTYGVVTPIATNNNPVENAN